ncbi:hypothetical protein [Streptomyces alboflavus]|uniref:hypothetical protein n=1 Tax=Streptomyces alboflavus TaxID=67267 RepID=UPI000F658574|nr:hypothetical protein [Streptomyces alboflavus]
MTRHEPAALPAFRIGDADPECRYPIFVGTKQDRFIGHVFRWHKPWYAVPASGKLAGTEQRFTHPAPGDENPDPDDAGPARPAREQAIRWLLKAVADREADHHITPVHDGWPLPPTPVSTTLLHPRMVDTPTNRKRAAEVITSLAALCWQPIGGYPGSDNPWMVRCLLHAESAWEGPLYWSHLRGRNRQLPSTYRHKGCLPDAEVRARVPAYQA